MEVDDLIQLKHCAFGDMLNVFAEQDAAASIWPYMEVCGRTGLLYSDTTTFIMARPVDSSLPLDDLNSLKDMEPDYPKMGLTDTWHILYGSGNMSLFLDLMPYPLPKVMWQRNCKGKARIYSLTNIKRHIHD